MTNYKATMNYIKRVGFFIEEISDVVETLEEKQNKGKATDYEIMLKNRLKNALDRLEQ